METCHVVRRQRPVGPTRRPHTSPRRRARRQRPAKKGPPMLPSILLGIQTLLPAVLTGVFLLAEKSGAVGERLPGWAQQLIIGVAFGAVAIFDTETSVLVAGGAAGINVRDAAPVVAGLAFGAPAGIIAGVIGGVERWLCVAWGGAEATRLACAVSTVAAGVVAAVMRTWVFEDKRPGLGYAVGVGLGVVTFDMLLIMLTNMSDSMASFEYVQECCIQMTLLNGLACGIAFAGQSFIRRDRLFVRPPYLISDLATKLFAVFALAFIGIFFSTIAIMVNMSFQQSLSTLTANSQDLKEEVERFGWDAVLDDRYAWRVMSTGSIIVYDAQTGEVTDGKYSGQNIKELMSTDPFTLEQDDCNYLTVGGSYCYVMRCTFPEDGREVILYLPEDETDAIPNVMLFLFLDVQVLMLFILFVVLCQLLRRRVVNNLQLAESGLAAVAHGNLDTRVDISSHQEFVKLSEDINTTVDALKGYIDEAEHRHDSELALARQIQHSALPSVFPPFPDRIDFDLYASMDAAREVGGDFYDFFLLNDHTLVFLIADVSGKGVPAALFMMKAKTEIHSLMETNIGVDEAFTRANERLCEANESGMFVTAWLGKLDVSTGELAYANAGHNPPLLKRASGEFEYLRQAKPNFFLAGMEGIRYRKNSVTLGPGDKLFLYTDGVTEACDPSEALFGEKRLVQTLNSTGQKETPRGTCDAVAQAVKAHAAGAEQSDDITMLCVSLCALCGRDRVVTSADRDSLAVVSAFLDAQLPRLGASPRVVARVQVVVDEAYSNICNYSGASTAVMSIVRKGADLLIEFVDDGVEFDPTAAPPADTTLSAEQRKIGGLGIHMMRKMSASMDYRRVDDTNILTVAFSFD